MSYNRRKFLSVTTAGLATIPLLSVTTQNLWAADKLAENDPMAMALGYFEDASKTDTTRFPKRSGPEGAKQFCENCAQFKATDAGWGTCAIFPGKLVAAKGWCNVWVPIP